uniref:(northern house mosquito) hypothetical protein n=1 Tax=Culex pipiens TaxID=7175 RepID=A0A8D8MTA4_CULPI
MRPQPAPSSCLRRTRNCAIRTPRRCPRRWPLLLRRWRRQRQRWPRRRRRVGEEAAAEMCPPAARRGPASGWTTRPLAPSRGRLGSCSATAAWTWRRSTTVPTSKWTRWTRRKFPV